MVKLSSVQEAPWETQSTSWEKSRICWGFLRLDLSGENVVTISKI